MVEQLRRFRAEFLAPLAFLLLCILAFGLQIPWLGYYVDDWIILHADNIGGAERLFHYAFLGNRPLVFWFWWVGFRLLGSTPLHWHIWALLWRWLAVVIIWMGWRRLWPRHPLPVTLAAMLFAVYPIFRQQPTALTYSFHWICFFLYGVSIYSMIRAAQEPRRYAAWTALAVLAGSIQLFSQEFYVGLELLRPAVLWLALGSHRAARARWKTLLIHWLPYLLLLAGYLVWRVALMPTPGSDRNSPDLLVEIASNPLNGLITLATMFFQDTVEMLAGIWYKTYRPDVWTIRPLSNAAAWVVMVITLGLVAAFWRLGWLGREREELGAEERWNREAVLFGFAAMIAGFLPGWSIGRHIYDLTGIYNDRFGLAAMPGAALLVVGLCRILFQRRAVQLGVVLLLIALAAGHNFRTTTDYRWSWERQRELYWQLKWRAPVLEQPTAVLADGALVPYIGSWATISALGQMYAPHQDTPLAPYWYIELPKFNVEQHISEDAPIRDERNFLRYEGGASESIVIHFNPDAQQCLWVLRPEDDGNLYLSERTREALALSNLVRIQAEPEEPLRGDIFGAEPFHNWCYYFQKADLARQMEEWQQITGLWAEAQAAGLEPGVGIEYLPFIEGYAHSGDWSQAEELTRQADYPHFNMQVSLCDTWKSIAETAPASPERDTSAAWAKDHLGCP